ncbi:hypothetical protein [Hydrogenophaga sp. OTU3427]|uniref:hypothetical protein n=1 Tax=Hydrogenophaga sp. OTU3427 TaxID=3043856 RepID=UPI00313E2787
MKLGMNRHGAALMALAVSITSAAAGTPVKQLQEKGLKPLAHAELMGLLPGNTLYHVNHEMKVKVPLFYVPDGTRYVRIRGQILESRWRIEGDKVCEHSVVLKRDVCRSLYRFDGGGAVCDDGADVCEYGLDWAAGNPEGLGK